MKKKFYEGKVEPGAYQQIFRQSDFNCAPKQEFLQFFGTTDSKIKEENFVLNKNNNVGPGAYE